MVKTRKEQFETSGGSEGDTIEISSGDFIFAPNVGGGGGENLSETLAIGNTTGGSNISMTDGDDIRAADGYLDLNVLSTGANPALVRFQEDGTDFLTFNPAASVNMNIGETAGDFTIQYEADIAGVSGGNISLIAQSSPDVGNGGSVTINAGDAGVSNGNGGSITISAGDTAMDSPGAVNIIGGTNSGGTSSGGVNIRSSPGGVSSGAPISIDGLIQIQEEGTTYFGFRGPSAIANFDAALTFEVTTGGDFLVGFSGTSLTPGTLYIEGQGPGNGAVGGDVNITGGERTTLNADGGNVNIAGGNGVGTGDGGIVTLSGGTGVIDGYVLIDGKLTVTGLIDPTGLVLEEQASVPGGTPATGNATIWIRSSDGYAILTDDNGIDTVLSSGGGSNQTLAETLVFGNTTEGTDLIISDGVNNLMLLPGDFGLPGVRYVSAGNGSPNILYSFTTVATGSNAGAEWNMFGQDGGTGAGGGRIALNAGNGGTGTTGEGAGINIAGGGASVIFGSGVADGGDVEIRGGLAASGGISGTAIVSSGNGTTADSGHVVLDIGAAAGTSGVIKCTYDVHGDATGPHTFLEISRDDVTGSGVLASPDGYVVVNDDLQVYGDGYVNGKLTVTGLIDPTGLVLETQASVPGGTPAVGEATIWVRSSDGEAILTDENGSDTILSGGAAASNQDLASVLNNGNTSDGYDIIIDGGGELQVFGDGYIDGKLTVTGLIDPTGLTLETQATVPGGTPAAGDATLWVRSSDGYVILTDDAGDDNVISSVGGSGSGTTTGINIISETTSDGYIEDFMPSTAFDEDAIENIIRFDGYVGGTTITGVEAPSSPIKITFFNLSVGDLTFLNEDDSSMNANQILIGGGIDLSLATNDALTLVYDDISQRWRVT